MEKAQGDTKRGGGQSWEDIANEIAPAGARPGGLATGARRGPPLRHGSDLESRLPEASAHPRFDQKTLRVIPCPPCRPDAPFDEVLGGAECVSPRHGAYYAIQRPAIAYDAHFDSLAARLRCVLQDAPVPALAGARAEDLLFLDIETTGLSSDGPLFLVGTLAIDGRDGQAHIEILLARDLSEECALLAAFHARAQGKTLITFNGKAFDWPYIERRTQKHRLSLHQPRTHFDLLYHARRVWKQRHALPDCKLQTLEMHLCRRGRRDDVPSARIPERYHQFVETRAVSSNAAHLLVPIVHHNALDVLTLAELLCLTREIA